MVLCVDECASQLHSPSDLPLAVTQGRCILTRSRAVPMQPEACVCPAMSNSTSDLHHHDHITACTENGCNT